jgi:hypothetical protein
MLNAELKEPVVLARAAMCAEPAIIQNSTFNIQH